MEINSVSEFKDQINFFGEFRNEETEKEFLNFHFAKRKSYFLLSYFICTFLFFFHGIFDFKREFVTGSPEVLMGTRAFFLALCIHFIYRFKNIKFPKFLYEYCFVLQLMSVLIILMLTIFTGGLSKTLHIGTMIMYSSFYIMLPGRSIYAFISSFLITCVYIFLADRGDPNFYLISFIIISSNVILWFFCRNNHRHLRFEYLSNQKFQELIDMKTKMLSVLAHDIRTPLQVVLMRTSIGKRDVNNDRYDRQIDHLESIKVNAYKIEELVKDLLNWTFNKEKNEESSFKENSSNLLATLENSISYVKEAADLKEISLKPELKYVQLKHDSTMLETVFRNLLSNSIKFSPDKSLIRIKLSEDERFVFVVITDKGAKISDEQIKKIISGDGKSSTDGTRGEKGFGVGLRLVRTFLHFHKGNLEIESSEKGNVFTLKFQKIYN